MRNVSSELKDKFGNEIHIGDYVIFSRDVEGRHGKLFRGKVTKICKRSLWVNDGEHDVYVFPECYVRDNSDVISELQERDIFLSCLEACGVDNWGDYSMAQEMYDNG